MKCNNPITLTKNLNPYIYPDGLKVPCGKCTECRIRKRSEWSLRMQHELTSWENSIFVTLTYSDEYLPKYASLDKEGLRKFFKRLRKRLSIHDRKIKYFACGEYGPETQRPHYHAIIFGMSLREEDKQFIRDSWPLCDWNSYKINLNSFGLAEPDSIRYVAQYIDKKFTGEKAHEEYINRNRESVFKICSLGIGKDFCRDNSKKLIQDCYVQHNGKKMSLPRYYLKKLEEDGHDMSNAKQKAKQLESEIIEKITGISDLKRFVANRILSTEDVRSIEREEERIQRQHNKNLEAKLELFSNRKKNGF